MPPSHTHPSFSSMSDNSGLWLLSFQQFYLSCLFLWGPASRSCLPLCCGWSDEKPLFTFGCVCVKLALSLPPLGLSHSRCLPAESTTPVPHCSCSSFLLQMMIILPSHLSWCSSHKRLSRFLSVHEYLWMWGSSWPLTFSTKKCLKCLMRH